MKKMLLAAAVSALFCGQAMAADAKAGEAKFKATCSACHGAEGISANDLWPNLAGQKSKYVVKQIKAFKAGDRKDPSMAPMVAALTDADIENIAAYVSTLKGLK